MGKNFFLIKIKRIYQDNTEECAVTLKNQKYGLLTLSDFISASVDPTCKSASTKSCRNYNYLVNKKFDWWLVTACNEGSSKVFQVRRTGSVSVEDASSYGIVRPVILMNSKVLYKSGNGTLEKPYKIRQEFIIRQILFFAFNIKGII